MKLKFTPLILLCGIAMLYAGYIIFSGQGGNLNGLVFLAMLFIVGVSLTIYFLLRKIFKEKLRKQVLTEFLLILIIAFVYYKKNGKLVLHVPKDYKGYIIMVYGADKKPKLPVAGLFNANIKVSVPPSGIIITSSKRTKTIAVLNSSTDNKKLLKGGYDFPIVSDSLNCGNKKYYLNVLFVGERVPGWSFKRDTVIRNVKKELACRMLSDKELR